MNNPFKDSRDPALPPYHLRNGVTERAEIDAHEAEHRRRMGMPRSVEDERARFEAWTKGHAIEFSERELSMCWLAWQAAQR